MKSPILYVVLAPIAAMCLAASCGSAHKPAPTLSRNQSSAPALSSAAKPEGASPKLASPALPASGTPAPPNDPVGELIAQVEKEYQSGRNNYHAGHLEAARQSFDRAFNLMAGSTLDLQDDRLQQEFDKIVEGVNGLELQALQEGDGFTEQRLEPAPIDEANEITFPVDPNIRAKAEAEVKATPSDLPLMITDEVASYINYFSTRGRGTIEHALARAGRYREMIQGILKQEGVPQDLIYLAQAESGFHPLAVSRAGARGMWQFMGWRGQSYGLQHSWWVDDRQDPEKATRAAARHLKDLYNQFGDWYLAMAAYNSGPGTVQSAVKRTGYADFWELYRRNVLPRETRNYVPIILAVTIMAKNPEQYGLDSIAAEKPLRYETVRIDYPIDLRLVAECVDASAFELQELNPSLLRMTTPKDQAFDLRLPEGTKDKYLKTVAGVPQEMRVWWRYHKVQPGDTMGSIARTYRTSTQAIAEANNLAEDQVERGSKLIIPIAPGKQKTVTGITTYSRRTTAYKVRKGDTVQTVAAEFSVPASMVKRWNHLKGESLAGRRVVYVHLPAATAAAESRDPSSKPRSTGAAASRTKKGQPSGKVSMAEPVLHHRVKHGETLTSIASSYNTTVAALKRDNRNVALLRPGMVLVIREMP